MNSVVFTDMVLVTMNLAGVSSTKKPVFITFYVLVTVYSTGVSIHSLDNKSGPHILVTRNLTGASNCLNM